MLATRDQRSPPHADLLPLALIVAVFVTAVVTGGVIWRSMTHRLVEQAGERLALTAGSLAESIDRFLGERSRLVQMVARALGVRGQQGQQDLGQVTQYLQAIESLDPSMWIAVSDMDGRVIASSDGSGIGRDEGGRAWFQSIRHGNTLHIQEAPVSDGEAILIATPMVAEGRFVGAVLMRSERRSVTALVEEALRSGRLLRQEGTVPEYRILTSDGSLIVDSSADDVRTINLRSLGVPSATLSFTGRSGYIEEMHVRRHVPVVTGYSQITVDGRGPELRWAITVSLDRADVLASIRRDVTTVAIGMSLGCLVLAGLVAGMVGRARWTRMPSHEKEPWAYATLKSMGVGVVVVDSKGCVAFVNPAAEELTGWSAKEAKGHPLADIVTGVETRHGLDSLDPRRAARSAGHHRFIARDGSKQGVICAAAPIITSRGISSGSVVVCTSDDETPDCHRVVAHPQSHSDARTGDSGDESVGREESPPWESLRHWIRLAEVNRVCLFEVYRGEDGTLWASRRYEWIGLGAIVRTEWSQWFSWSMRAKGFSRWEELLSDGHVVSGNVEDFPNSEQAALSSCGIHMVFVAPVMIRKAWWGFIEFDHCLGTRKWTSREIDGLRTVTDQLSAAFRLVNQDEELQGVLTELDTSLESAADGVLVVDEEGQVVSLNRRLLTMWRLPDAVVESRSVDHILPRMTEQLIVPDALLRTISELNNHPDAESYDILHLKDGRRIARFSRPKREGRQLMGREWSFHEIQDMPLSRWITDTRCSVQPLRFNMSPDYLGGSSHSQ